MQGSSYVDRSAMTDLPASGSIPGGSTHQTPLTDNGRSSTRTRRRARFVWSREYPCAFMADSRSVDRIGPAARISLSASSALASTITVKLWDKGAAADMAMDRGISGTGDMSKATMGLKLSATTVKAGMTTFEVTNSSKDTVHEMVVFPYKDGETIPYSTADSKINEDNAGHLGEVSELEPGKSGMLKISLKPGKYVLTCNIPNHYMNGMWAIITVK